MTDAAEILAQALNPEHWSDPRYVAHREKDIEDARAALTAVLDAVTLEWEKTDDCEWSAEGMGHTYRVWECYEDNYLVNTDADMEHRSLAAAQTAALADYRARLARALGMGEG